MTCILYVAVGKLAPSQLLASCAFDTGYIVWRPGSSCTNNPNSNVSAYRDRQNYRGF